MDRISAKRKSVERKRQRIRKKVAGTAERPRLAVYRSERHIYGQLIDDEAGRTVLSVSTMSKDLKDQLKEANPTDAARSVGEVLAEKAQAAGIAGVVFDRGGRRYAGRIAAFADGARAKGLQF